MVSEESHLKANNINSICWWLKVAGDIISTVKVAKAQAHHQAKFGDLAPIVFAGSQNFRQTDRQTDDSVLVTMVEMQQSVLF